MTSERTAPRRARGELKRAVMRVLWDQDRALTAREVVNLLGPEDGRPAITTVITVLDRLRRSGEIVRDTTGSEYRYVPVSDESQVAVEAMLRTLTAARDRSGALLGFAGALTAEDVALLRRTLGESRPQDLEDPEGPDVAG